MRSRILKLFALGFIATSLLGFANQVPEPKEEKQANINPPVWEEVVPTQQRDIASVEFPMLTFEQILRMPSTDVYKYYSQLHKVMAELEKFQLLDKKSDKFARLMNHIFINLSDAGTETLPPYKVGTDCLIGGYWGKWTYRKDIPGIQNKNGMTCISPNRCALPGDSAGSPSGHMCNPKYFTYSNASSRTEWCVNLKKDLTANGCITLLEKRYNEMCDQDRSQGCRPFADHFKRSVLQAIAADAKYKGISEADAVNQYKQEVFTEFQRIRNYCGDTKAEWDKHSAGQQYSCFRLMSHYQQLQETVKEIAPAAPPKTTANADGLGPYACIKQGLVNAGFPGASNKHIAMFAVRAKDQADDTFLISLFSGKEGRRHTTMENTILSVASVGVCQNQPLSADDARKTAYWLNRDRLNNLNDNEYARVFGVPKTQVIPRGGWRNYPYRQRRGSWESLVKNEAVKSCPRKPSEADSTKLCKQMTKACGMDDDICEYKPPREHEGGNGGSNDGHGPGGSGGETGPGSNADSHGSDNGGGHGNGPG